MKLDDLLREMEEASEGTMYPPPVIPTQAVEYNQWFRFRVIAQPDNILRIIAALRKRTKALLEEAQHACDYGGDCRTIKAYQAKCTPCRAREALEEE